METTSKVNILLKLQTVNDDSFINKKKVRLYRHKYSKWLD